MRPDGRTTRAPSGSGWERMKRAVSAFRRTCPQCLRDYELDVPLPTSELEPWQRQQHQYPPYCSDKCYDEAISGHRPEYTYDEKGRRFDKDGVRKLFPEPPE